MYVCVVEDVYFYVGVLAQCTYFGGQLACFDDFAFALPGIIIALTFVSCISLLPVSIYRTYLQNLSEILWKRLCSCAASSSPRRPSRKRWLLCKRFVNLVQCCNVQRAIVNPIHIVIA